MELEKALFKWCVEQRAKKMHLDDEILQQKAVSLWPEVPACWLQHFKFKHKINFIMEEGNSSKCEDPSKTVAGVKAKVNQSSIAETQIQKVRPPSTCNCNKGRITLRQQIALLEELEKGELVAVLAHKYGISAAQVYGIKYKRDRILLYAKESIEHGEEANLDQYVLPTRNLNIPRDKKLHILAEYDKGSTLQDLAHKYGVSQTSIFGIIERRATIFPQASSSAEKKFTPVKNVSDLKKDVAETEVVRQDGVIYYITSKQQEDSHSDQPHTSQLAWSKEFDEESPIRNLTTNQRVPNKSKVSRSLGIKRECEVLQPEKRIKCAEASKSSFADEFDRWRSEIKMSCRSLAATKQSQAVTATVKEEIIVLSDDDDDNDDNKEEEELCYHNNDYRQVAAVKDEDDESCEYILPDNDGVLENPPAISITAQPQQQRNGSADPVTTKLSDLRGCERKLHGVPYDCFDLADERFQEIFSLPKRVCQRLLAEISPFLEGRKQVSGLSKQLRFLVALLYFTQGKYERHKRFEEECTNILNVSESSFSRCVLEVTNVMNAYCISKYVKFPTTSEEIKAVKRSFFENFNVPGVIGVIGHTYVKMKTPRPYNEHSMYVQVVCDHQMRILDCYSRFSNVAGSASTWRESPLRENLEGKYSNGERNSWLLGDGEYPQLPILMTPLRGPNITAAEAYYNKQHRRARNCIQHCIEQLTSKFRCLSRTKGMCYGPASATKIINSCIILHNLLIDHSIVNNSIQTPAEWPDDREDNDAMEDRLNDIDLIADCAGIAARQKVVDDYFGM